MDVRPDLRAQRKRLEAQKFALKQSLINAGVAFNLDGGYTYQFSPNQGANQSLNLTLSYPLFDGGFRRANVRQDRATLESNVQTLTQAERTARAEIESAYTTLEQNVDRLAAAKAAVEAARVNYAAALGAQQAGASDLIEVLTAQVSLVTAESNYIEAVYDSLISDLRLKLVTGKPLPGE
jgi:outer membrane protein